MGRGSQDLADRYGLRVYAQEQDWHDYSGFYHKEKWGERFYRWSGEQGGVKTEDGRQRTEDGGQRAEGGGSVVEFDVQCHTPGVEKEAVVVTVSLDGKSIDEIVFNRKESKIRWYFVGNGRNEFLFDVSRTWNPRKLGISQDSRDLGVAVSEPRFLKEIPEGGVGFYKTESVQLSGGRGQGVRRFRWTGGRASEKTDDGGQKTEDGGLVVYLMCSHPGIDKKPVVVKVLGDGEVLRYLEFKDYDWKRVEVGAEELKGKTVITYEVSRTWNPKRMGVSGDWRDLGVAVGVR